MSYQNLHFKPDTTFLVTGGAGFIGSNLAEAILGLGYRVKVLDNLSTGKMENIQRFMANEHFEFVQADIRDFDACQKACQNVDYVLHQAALGSVPRSIQDPRTSTEVNVIGTLNMMMAARDNNVLKFVYASSASVFGDEPNLPKVEGREGKLLSPYAITKKVNELYGSNFNHLYGLKTVGLRYFNVFGKRQDPLSGYAAVIPQFVRCLLNNEAPTIFGDGNQSRDFVYIENVIEANLKACLARERAYGEVFNIACNDRKSLLEVYDLLCQLLNKQIKPNFAAERPGDIRHSFANIDKAREYLGYDPAYRFEEGLKLTIDWYRANLAPEGKSISANY